MAESAPKKITTTKTMEGVLEDIEEFRNKVKEALETGAYDQLRTHADGGTRTGEFGAMAQSIRTFYQARDPILYNTLQLQKELTEEGRPDVEHDPDALCGIRVNWTPVSDLRKHESAEIVVLALVQLALKMGKELGGKYDAETRMLAKCLEDLGIADSDKPSPIAEYKELKTLLASKKE